MRGLEAKVAVIAGAGGSIGRAIVARLMQEGCRVACLDISLATLRAEMSAEESARCAIIEVDLADERQVGAAVDDVVQRFGRVDFLVNAAGVVGPTATVENIDLEEFEQLFRANVRTAFVTTQAVLRRLHSQGEGGAIVNLSSTAAERSRPGRSLYGMTKRAIVGLTIATALENVDHRVRANCVTPGPVDSDMYRKMVSEAPPTGQAEPVRPGPLGQPGQVASMVAFLLSDEAEHCTGHTYFVDGGLAA